MTKVCQMTPDKKVKILATLGPAIRDAAHIRHLVEAGVNLFRLNFSHGEHADHAQRYQWVREVERELNQPIGILMDLQGPKLRVGRFAEGKVQLVNGQSLLLDDGRLRLKVIAKQAEATASDAISCAIRHISSILPVAALVNYTESGASSLRTSRERPKAPILSLTPSLTTARRLIVAWASTRWLTNTCARSRKSPAPPWKSPQAQGLAKRGETVVITAGEPFGQPGSIKSLRIETLHRADDSQRNKEP
ncbi:pyruvate kinase [Ectopseudomonas oleovorans]|jgi:pyruvate kinase|uniref:pyruvate kinase n=1 Tax=Ectopseudomonas oleovorans TaxID=301 RepID=UPI0026845A22